MAAKREAERKSRNQRNSQRGEERARGFPGVPRKVLITRNCDELAHSCDRRRKRFLPEQERADLPQGYQPSDQQHGIERRRHVAALGPLSRDEWVSVLRGGPKACAPIAREAC